MTKSKKELCAMYGISYPTLQKKLSTIKDLQVKPGDKLIFASDLELIYKLLGNPDILKSV